MFDTLTTAERWELTDLLYHAVDRNAGLIRALCSRRYIPFITMRRLRRSYRHHAVIDDITAVMNDLFTAPSAGV